MMAVRRLHVFYVATAIALVLPGQVFGAFAEGASESDSPPTPSEDEVAAADMAELRGFSQAHGISLEAAADLRSFEEEALDVMSEAARHYPDVFAGGWIENREAGGRLVLAFTRDAAENAKAVGRGSSVPDRIRGVNARRSVSDLNATRKAVRAEWDRLETEVGLFGMSLRAGINRVVLQVQDLSPEVIQQLEEEFGPENILVEESTPPRTATIPPAATACETIYTSCNPLRGGILLQGHGCSQGFNARRRDTGAMVVTSAGHCGNVTVSHSNSTVGAYIKGWYGGTLDAQIHAVGSGWSTSRWVLANNSAQAYQTGSVYTGTNLSNVTVCSSGRTTGPFGGISLCGAVTDHDWEGKNADGVSYSRQFVAYRDPEPAGGDSGGPVFGDGRAYGVLWGSTESRLYASYAYFLQENLKIDIRTW